MDSNQKTSGFPIKNGIYAPLANESPAFLYDIMDTNVKLLKENIIYKNEMQLLKK